MAYPLSGQHTPGTKRVLKQMDFLRPSMSARRMGHSLRSMHRPESPVEVTHFGAEETIRCWVPPPATSRSPRNSSLSILAPSAATSAVGGLCSDNLWPSNSTAGSGGKTWLIVFKPSPICCIPPSLFECLPLSRKYVHCHLMCQNFGSTISNW